MIFNMSRFKIEDMVRKGYHLNGKGVWEKPKSSDRKAQKKVKTPQIEEKAVQHEILRDSIIKGEGWCKITISGVMPGLNSLLREHFMVRKRRKEDLVSRLTALSPPSIAGTVSVEFAGYCSKLSDWENFCCKFKILGDALVDMKVIEGDSPDTIIKFTPTQFKCKRKEQRAEVLIQKI